MPRRRRSARGSRSRSIGDGAELARVVAPDAQHARLRAARRARSAARSAASAGRGAVQRHHRLADVDAHLAGPRRQRRRQQRQVAARARPAAARSAPPPAGPAPAAAPRTREACTRCTPGSAATAAHEGRVQPGLVGGRAAAGGCAHTGRPAAPGPASLSPPRRKLATITVKRHRQRQAGHHAGHRRAGGVALEARALQRQQRQRAPRRRHAGQQRRAPPPAPAPRRRTAAPPPTR